MKLPTTPTNTRPLPPLPADVIWESISKDAETGCWIWTGHLDKNGYGDLYITHKGETRKILAHRAVYTLQRGVIPDGLVIDHLCRTVACVNPEHLEVVDQRTNTARGTGPTAAAAANWLRGLCGNGHVLAEVGIYSQGRGQTCGQCGRDRAARYRLRKKLAKDEAA